MRNPDHTRRVVVTGLGVISPVGNDVATAWSNLTNGVSGLDEITRFDVSGYNHKAAGEVRDFEAVEWIDPKAVRRSERGDALRRRRGQAASPTRASRSATPTVRTSESSSAPAPAASSS